ncbi:MAG TPA: OmpA family protein [Bacteroidia bacterium]|nr:OmpA family protein [Bacteroidia bacterium]
MKFTLAVFLFSSFHFLEAQNLILNPGLELKDTFQNITDINDSFSINHCPGWYSVGGSVDFFNSDGKHIYTGSHLFSNRIKAHSGNCYGGMYIDNSHWAECVGISFDEPLDSGKNYRMEMFLNISPRSKYAFYQLEMDFIDTLFYDYKGWRGLYNKFPPVQIPKTNQLQMVGNWVKVSVDFTAMGGEKGFILGYFDNFFRSELLPVTMKNRMFDPYVYYYFDDFSLIQVEGTPIERTIPNRPIIYFDVDRFVVKKEFFPDLDKVVIRMKQEPLLKIELDGFTDIDGSDQTNQILSEKRAQAVANYLIAHGADAKRITTKGFSEKRPAGAEKARNRRVEFVYYQ